MERCTERFARNVPQRNVDTGQRLKNHAFLPMVPSEIVDDAPMGLPPHRVLPHKERRDHLLHYGAVGLCVIAGAETRTPSGDPFARCDVHEVGSAATLTLLGVAQLFAKTVLEDMRADCSDFHDLRAWLEGAGHAWQGENAERFKACKDGIDRHGGKDEAHHAADHTGTCVSDEALDLA